MDPLTYTVASGIRARLEALDMLANNIANASTSGFKKDSEFYGIYQGEMESAQAEMPVVERNWTDFSQGTLQNTGAPLDFGLQGPGWFTVETPQGPVYTRNGNFHVTTSGVVATAEGYPVKLSGGSTLRINPAQPVQVGSDGIVTQAGTPVGKLDIVEFGPDELRRHGASFFRPVDAKSKGTQARSTEVHQGKLENANVSAPEAAVRLVNLTRQFEGLQKALQIGAEMNRRAIEEVAKV